MDTSKIREALSSSTVTLLVDTFMIIVGVYYYIYKVQRCCSLQSFYTIFILCSLMMKQPFEHYNQKVAENDAELSSYLIESFDGSSTIKVTNQSLIVLNKVRKSLINLSTT